MRLLVLLSLAFCASALPKTPPARQLKVLAHSTTRSKKAFCKDASQIQNGTWVLLDEGEYQEAPSVCNPQKMMWEPDTCKLPYHSDEIKKQSGRVVIIGDSIADNAARSFAWFYGKIPAKERNDCSYKLGSFKKKIEPQLKEAGLNQGKVAATLAYIEANGFRKNHHWWGCNSSVMYIPSDSPPAGDTAKGFLHAMIHFPAEPLGPKDTLVLNWGAWEKEDKDHVWLKNMKSFMKEYAKLHNEKKAPKLIWREMSPMHWGGDGGKYTKEKFEDAQTTQGCGKISPAQIDRQLQIKGEFPLSNTIMISTAMKEVGLKFDGTNMEFLPIWRGSAERYEDHQLLSKYQKANYATIDCTHYCVHGNVHRFWNSAIVTTIAAMNMKNMKDTKSIKNTKNVKNAKKNVV